MIRIFIINEYNDELEKKLHQECSDYLSNQLDEYAQALYCDACINQDLILIDRLIQMFKIDVNKWLYDVTPLIHEAINSNNIEMAKLFIKYDGKINDDILEHAVSNVNSDFFEFLLCKTDITKSELLSILEKCITKNIDNHNFDLTFNLLKIYKNYVKYN